MSVYPARVERGPDVADLAVHHPGEPEHRRAGGGLCQRHRGVALEGGVVVDRPVVGEHAAVPVVGELVEAEVGHDDEVVADGVDAPAAARR